jgi:hypothetical protein
MPTKGSLLNNTGGVQKPSTDTKTWGEGQETGETKGKAGDIRLRSASKPRRSPWKHVTDAV